MTSPAGISSSRPFLLRSGIGSGRPSSLAHRSARARRGRRQSRFAGDFALVHRSGEAIGVAETVERLPPGLLVRRREQDAVDVEYAGGQYAMSICSESSGATCRVMCRNLCMLTARTGGAKGSRSCLMLSRSAGGRLGKILRYVIGRALSGSAGSVPGSPSADSADRCWVHAAPEMTHPAGPPTITSEATAMNNPCSTILARAPNSPTRKARWRSG